ncbi:TIGR04141 family sporadically distributed protein [Rhodovibrio salinarum]|uniref:TIGR04141 family sporadically distributed protein n=1 Tax=Rhodovibrio salinarum TaxID=1087 RepID=UPI0004BAAAD6|nr:TIGR04141 family sporadically distributed protein [Rhodovibrio salinarum]
MRKKTFTLYLAKEDTGDFNALLSEGALERLNEPSTRVVEVDEFGDGAKVFVFTGSEHEPRWLTELRNEFGIAQPIQTKSTCALVIFRTAERTFAATFGHGWMYLKEENLEGDFGLRVALNALDESKLKRLERANLGDALRGVALSPFQRNFSSFGLDDALDLVRKVSGNTRDEASAEAVTGSRSLKVSGEFEISNLPELARISHEGRCIGV